MPDLRTLTSKNLPGGGSPAPKQAVVTSVDAPGVGKIVAKPLSSPDFLGIKAKDPAFSVRWVNRMYENGHRVDVHIAQGFEIAKPDQVVCLDGKPVPASLCKNGQLIYGDLVAMILPKADYLGALLNNHNKAVKRVRKVGIQQRGEAMMGEELTQIPASRTDKSKITVYTPGDAHEIQNAVNEGRL